MQQTHRAPVLLQLRVVIGTHGKHQALGPEALARIHAQAQINLFGSRASFERLAFENLGRAGCIRVVRQDLRTAPCPVTFR